MDNQVNLENFIQLNDWTLRDEINTTVYESEYNVKKPSLHGNSLIFTHDHLEIDMSFFRNEEIVLHLGNDSLSDIGDLLEQDDILVDPKINFPQFKDLDMCLNILSYISKYINKQARVKLINASEFYDYIHGLEFLGYFRFNVDLELYEYTNLILEFLDLDTITQKYFHLLKQLGKNKTIRDVLLLQIRVREYDSITKSLIREKLESDLNLNNNNDIIDFKGITSNLRMWYSSIYRHVLKAGNIRFE